MKHGASQVIDQGSSCKMSRGFVNLWLADATRLRIEFHPYDSTPRVASFNVRAFARFIPALQRAGPDAGLRTPS